MQRNCDFINVLFNTLYFNKLSIYYNNEKRRTQLYNFLFLLFVAGRLKPKLYKMFAHVTSKVGFLSLVVLFR